MTKTHPIYKWEIPTQVNKSYVFMTLIQLDNWVQNVVKTSWVGGVTLASCLGIMYTRANSGNWVWWPHPQGSVVDRTQPPHAKTQHNNMASVSTSKEESSGMKGKWVLTLGDGGRRHFTLLSKFPITDRSKKFLNFLWPNLHSFSEFEFFRTIKSHSASSLMVKLCNTSFDESWQ